MKNSETQSANKDGSTFEELIEVLTAECIDPNAVLADIQQWRESNGRSKR